MIPSPNYFIVLSLFMAITFVACNNSSDTKNMVGFIVGGDETNVAEFPHAVCLFQYPMYKFFCGSSVLNQQVLLTAAHCVYDDHDDGRHFTFDAYAGHEDVEKVKIIRKVSRFLAHENYDPETTQNDLALMFFDDSIIPIGPGSPIRRVIIHKRFPLHVTEAVVSGWGVVDDVTKETSHIMKSTDQHVYSLEECQEHDEWMPGMLCAGHSHSDIDRPSKGDSGGGLMTANHEQIGIVSFTTADDVGLIYYTNTSYFYDWIVKTVQDNICDV